MRQAMELYDLKHAGCEHALSKLLLGPGVVRSQLERFLAGEPLLSKGLELLAQQAALMRILRTSEELAHQL